MDGLCSNITYMYVTVDTVTPQISFNNEFETYEEGIYLHGICSKDTIDKTTEEIVLQRYVN